MKVIIEKGITYKVTGEKGSFTICEDNKGKVKMFQTCAVEVVEVTEMPKAKVYKKSTHESNANARYIAYEKKQLHDAKYSQGIYKNQ